MVVEKPEANVQRFALKPSERLPFLKPVAGVMTVVPAKEESRTEPRSKVFQTGSYTVSGVAVPIHLLNISSLGAQVYAQKPPRIGDLLSINCGISLGRARVSWVDGKRFGLCFLVPLSDLTRRKLQTPKP